jgi:gas vesicle protein
MATLKNYLKSGGVLFVEAAIKGTKLEELIAVKKQLKEALNNLGSLQAAELAKFQKDLNEELVAVAQELENEVQNLSIAFEDFANQVGAPLKSINQFPQPSSPTDSTIFIF